MTDSLKFIEPFPEKPCSYWPGQDVPMQLYALTGMVPLSPGDAVAGLNVHALRRPVRMEGVKKGFLSMSYGSVAPLCPTCRACVPLRVNIEKFSLSASQEKMMQQERYTYHFVDDLDKKEMYRLFSQYTKRRHGEKESSMHTWPREQFDEWLNFMPIVLTMFNKDTGRMAGFAGLEADAESAILEYIVFDPVYADDSIGKRLWLATMLLARDAELPHVYVGAWAKSNPKLDYKKNHSGLETYNGTEWIDFDPKIHVLGPDYRAMIDREKLTLR